MTSATLALISDRLVLGAIAVFALAMVALAVENGTRIGRARTSVPAHDAVEAAAPAGVGASAARHGQPAADRPSSTTGPVADEGAGVGVRRRWRRPALGTMLLAGGLLLTVMAIIARGLAAGRTPWSNMYEFTMVGVAAAVTSYLALVGRPSTRALQPIGPWVAAAAGLFLGLALTVLYTPAAGLIPVLDSAWLVVHVAAAIIAGGLFTVGAATTLLHLWQLRRERRQTLPRAGAWSAESLEQAAQTAYTIAFPIWTFAVIAGAIWAENSWGRYWGWDPKETWAFITWTCYAAYLHAQATGGWRGKKASWLALAGYVAFLFNFIGVNIWVGGLHSYAGV